jgi:hypothetical protein
MLPPSPWREFLEEIDRQLTEDCRCAVFGGFAVTQVYGLGRETNDIDVLDIVPRGMVSTLTAIAGKESALAKRHEVHLDVVVMANPPFNYKSRLRPMYEGAFTHLQLLVMDPYDVALTKLMRDSDKDFQDVLQLAQKVPFDLGLFEARYREELRDNTTGRPEDNDAIFRRWKTAILEDRGRIKAQIR